MIMHIWRIRCDNLLGISRVFLGTEQDGVRAPYLHLRAPYLHTRTLSQL